MRPSPGKAAADSDIVESRFIDLVPGVRVVQAVQFVSDDPAYAGTMTMRWEITGIDGGTRVDIIADDVPDGIEADDHAGRAGLVADELDGVPRGLGRTSSAATSCGWDGRSWLSGWRRS
jgi:hypothetical protein